MAKFIHNKSTYNVSLIDGKITIPVADKHQISDKDAEHDSIIDAVARGWVTVEGATSKTSAPAAAEKPVAEKNPMEGSTTIPKPNKKSAPAVTSSALGTGSAAEVPVETVAETSEVTKADEAK